METLLQDVRFAVRTLLRRPAFTAAALLTLALGIGANTAIFGVLDSVLLRAPEGVGEPDRLVALYTSDYSGPAYGASSYPDYLDLRASPVFDGVTAWTSANLGYATDARVASLPGLAVSASYFEVLRVRPVAGRFFRADEEDAPGDIAVVSYAFWQRELGGRDDAIGSIIRLNDRPIEVIGVTPPGFVGFNRGDRPDAWLPMRTAVRLGAMFGTPDQRGNRGFNMVARLAPGVTLVQAQEAMRLAAQRFHELYDAAWADINGDVRRLTVVAERQARVSPQARSAVIGMAGVLAGAAALVLLLCCANVAGLLVARASGRRREIGIRLSLGAARGRLVRQLLTESLVLSLAGGLVGVLLAIWGTDLLSRTEDLRGALSVPLELRTDVRTLGFAAAVALVTALIFGLTPALRSSRVDMATALRAESAGSGGSHRTLTRSMLAAVQIAVSVVLLVGAMLLVRTLRNAYAVDPGFTTEGVLVAETNQLPGGDPAEATLRTLEIRDRIEALPGVEAASWSWWAPLQGGYPRRGSVIQYYEPAPGEDMEVVVDHVGPGYFETLEIPVRAGRTFTDADREGAPPVAIVNEAFVRRFWAGRNALGLAINQGTDMSVVGVVADVRAFSPTRDPVPMIYLPALQAPRGTTFYIRTTTSPETIVPRVRELIAALAPGLEVGAVRTMQDQRGATLGGQRLAGGAVGLFALLALVLAAIGLYGVVAYAVSQRVREVGVRIALGARPIEVVGLFLRQALPVAGAGALAGLLLAFAATRALRSLLIGVAPTDPLSYGVAAAVLAAVALVATWWPARRATRVDPISALRAE